MFVARSCWVPPRRSSSGFFRSWAALASIGAVFFSAAVSRADPRDRFHDEMEACFSQEGGCSLCGADYSCDLADGTCSWGALSFDEANAESAMDAGYALYCLGSSGVILNTATAAGVQSLTLRRSFRRLEGRADRGLTMGGVFEVNDPGGARPKIYGVTLPLSWTFTLDPLSDIDAQGNIIVGGGEGLYQYGLNVNPVYTRFLYGHEREQSWRVVAGGGLPLQFVGTSGDGFDFAASWLVGVSGFAGASRRIGSGLLGLGVALDLRYAEGFSAPLHLALRSAHDLRELSSWLDDFVVQPGFSLDFGAGSAVGDTLQYNLLLGLEAGNWVAGYHASLQGSAMAHGIGVTYIGVAGALAAGRGAQLRDEEKPKVPLPPVPEPSTQPLTPATTPAVAPAVPAVSQPSAPDAAVPRTQPAEQQPTTQPAALD